MLEKKRSCLGLFFSSHHNSKNILAKAKQLSSVYDESLGVLVQIERIFWESVLYTLRVWTSARVPRVVMGSSWHAGWYISVISWERFPDALCREGSADFAPKQYTCCMNTLIYLVFSELQHCPVSSCMYSRLLKVKWVPADKGRWWSADQPGRNASERPIQTLRPRLCMMCMMCIPNAALLCNTACTALLVQCGYGVTGDP